MKVTKTNSFVEDYVTDTVYRKILNELRTRPDGTKKKSRGRKRELTPEIFRNYIHLLSMTGEYAYSAENAGLPEKRRQKYMAQSETFRGVSNLAQKNLGLRAKLAVYRAIEGREPGFVKVVNPRNKEVRYIEVGYIAPNAKVAMWYLEKVEKIGQVKEKDEIPQLGAPRNEEEAALLEGLLNKHYDYIQSKEATNAQAN